MHLRCTADGLRPSAHACVRLRAHAYGAVHGHPLASRSVSCTRTPRTDVRCVRVLSEQGSAPLTSRDSCTASPLWGRTAEGGHAEPQSGSAHARAYARIRACARGRRIMPLPDADPFSFADRSAAAHRSILGRSGGHVLRHMTCAGASTCADVPSHPKCAVRAPACAVTLRPCLHVSVTTGGTCESDRGRAHLRARTEICSSLGNPHQRRSEGI